MQLSIRIIIFNPLKNVPFHVKQFLGISTRLQLHTSIMLLQIKCYIRNQIKLHSELHFTGCQDRDLGTK